MHRILERQIKRYLGNNFAIQPELKTLFDFISETYDGFDKDQILLNRSLDLSSKEFLENNRNLEKTRAKVELQAQNLALEVAIRTKELDARIEELEDARKAMTNLLQDFETEQKALAMAKKKVEALVFELEKFKLAVDNASDQIIFTDIEGTVTYGNNAVEKNTGYSLVDVVGKKAGALWKSPMPTAYYQKMWDTIKVQKKTFISEIQNKRKDGNIYTAAINISPIINKKGELEFFVSIERDITKEKEIDRAKSEFVALASHELRTPLTAIDGLVSMILDGEYGPISKSLKQPLEDVNTSSQRLIHLVNDLLNLSRIQAGRLKYTLSDFPIADVITETVHLLQPLAEQKELQLIATQLVPNTVQGDLDKVKEVLNNLIGNSLKFTGRGTIMITTKVEDETTKIYVSDTGIGISQEDQLKLFNKFQQVGSQGKISGTGLGLHISKEITKKMGGDVWLETSEPGKGSTFGFSLPLAKSQLATKVKQIIETESQAHADQKSDIVIQTKSPSASVLNLQ